MAASNRQMNVRPAIFTPQGGGSPTVFSGVTSCNFDGGGSIQKFSGDGDRFPTTTVSDFSDPSITLTVAGLVSTPSIGSRGTFAATFKDAHAPNTVSPSTGDVTFTMVTAVIQNVSFTGQHRQFSTANVMIASESADGITPPLSLTVIS